MNNGNSITNDPELDGKYLGTISKDFVKVADNIKEASYQIRTRGYSDYPIFPTSRIEQPVGQLLYERETFKTEWNYYASFLKEFIERKLVSDEKEEDFKKAYKNPDEFCCLFVMDEEFTNFLFIPYPED
ncbi:hypothetical protein ACFLU5_02820 [Bacteroidota bacterium]